MKTLIIRALGLTVALSSTLVLPTAAIEFAVLGTLPGGNFPDSEATAVSADGAVIVGINQSFTASGDFQTEAFRWESDVMAGIGDLPGGAFESYARAVSADGKVIVGCRSQPFPADWAAAAPAGADIENSIGLFANVGSTSDPKLTAPTLSALLFADRLEGFEIDRILIR